MGHQYTINLKTYLKDCSRWVIKRYNLKSCKHLCAKNNKDIVKQLVNTVENFFT